MSEHPTERPDPRFGKRALDPFANPPAEPVDDEFANDSANPSTNDQSADAVNPTPSEPANGSPTGGRVIDFPHRDEPDDADPDEFGEDGAGDLDPDDEPGERSLVGPVVEAEVLTDAENAALDRRLSEVEPWSARTLAKVRAGAHPRVVVATATTLITHPHTKRTGKLVGRNLWYPVAGVGVAVKRFRDAHGAGRYERMMRQAELTGNQEAVLEWESRDVAEKQRRHERVMDWVRSPIDLVKALVVGILAFTGLLLALGVVLAIADSDISQVIAPIVGVIEAIRFTVWFLSVYGATLLLGATAGGVLYLWHTGRMYTEAPTWMAPSPTDPTAREVIPDEGAILSALRNLNLAPLNKKFKEGWTPRWVLATGRDGKGYRTQLELPAGVTVEMINKQKRVLAHNLVRLPVEVWPTEPKKQPGVLDLWVADQGILTEPVEAYPLLNDGDADYFRGVPVGVDQRGQRVTGKLMACNYAAAGIMGSGKTSLVIALLSGAMLDPLVDIEVYVMAHNADYDAMKPRLSVLVKGDEDSHITTAKNALQNLREEVTLRGKLLSELGGDETKVTRELAERDPRLRPRVAVFDECQELFRHEKYGAAAKELAIKLMMKARKCAITIIWVTPAPSADSLPRDLAKTVSHRVCFAIGDHQGNDAILGTGAHKRGITAVDLVAGEDIGTAMASGFSSRPGLLRTYHIRKDKQVDQITPIVQRALGEWKARSLPIEPDSAQVEQAPDLLADVATVMRQAGRKLMRTQEVLSGLAALNHAAYSGMTFTQLRDGLPEAARPYKTEGFIQVNAERVAEALAGPNLDDDPDADDYEE